MLKLIELQKEQLKTNINIYNKTFSRKDALLSILREHCKLVTKMDSNILQEKIDTVGDIALYLMDYCNLEGIDFASAIFIAWERYLKKIEKTDK